MIKVHRSLDAQYYFTVCARNGQVLATSETYKTKAALRRGIIATLKAGGRAMEVKRTLILENQIDKL